LLERTRATDPAGVDEARHFLEEAHRRCHPFTRAQALSYREVLEMAAELGDNDARLRYFDAAPPIDPSDILAPARLEEYRTKAQRYLEQAVDTGRADALRALADAYRTGALGREDPQQAYLYMYAYALAAPPPSHERFAAARANRAARLRALLSPEQAAEAERAATELVARCCN
ncbi:MAG TPA: hypothetical protein VFO79_13415, partial [Xanthomonadales bacterium]|nr:hypothetical protein [Xanthomonadales bacterium]